MQKESVMKVELDIDMSVLANQIVRGISLDQISDRVFDRIDSTRLIQDVADNINMGDLANYIDADEIARAVKITVDDVVDKLDSNQIAMDAADHINLEDLAENIDVSELARHVDLDDLAREIWDNISVGWLAKHLDFAKLSEEVRERINLDNVSVDINKLAVEVATLLSPEHVNGLHAEVAALKAEVAELRAATAQFSSVIAALRALRDNI